MVPQQPGPDGGRRVGGPSRSLHTAGIAVEPTSVTGAADVVGLPIYGSAAEIADGFRAFQAGGFDHLEVILWPPTLEALDAMAPVLALVT